MTRDLQAEANRAAWSEAIRRRQAQLAAQRAAVSTGGLENVTSPMSLQADRRAVKPTAKGHRGTRGRRRK
jgi:hypothetical protein